MTPATAALRAPPSAVRRLASRSADVAVPAQRLAKVTGAEGDVADAVLHDGRPITQHLPWLRHGVLRLEATLEARNFYRTSLGSAH